MYEAFYKLKSNPFRLNPDRRFCYGSRAHVKARAYLQYALQRAEGFIVITGQPGTGKSTLIDSLLANLGSAQVVIARLVSSQLGADDALRMVLDAYGLREVENNKSTLLRRLEEFLIEQHGAGRRTLLIIDEAQNLSLSALEEIRLMTNLMVHYQPLLQVFLVGQEGLRDLVYGSGMEQLRQRVIAACDMQPLRAEETPEYIRYRLREAGWKNDPSFTDAALRLVHQYSGGIPRRVNLICNRLLLYGSLEELHSLSERDVDVVMGELREEMLVDHASEPADELPDSIVSDPTPDRSAVGANDELLPETQARTGTHDEVEALEQDQAADKPASRPPSNVVVLPAGAAKSIGLGAEPNEGARQEGGEAVDPPAEVAAADEAADAAQTGETRGDAEQATQARVEDEEIASTETVEPEQAERPPAAAVPPETLIETAVDDQPEPSQEAGLETDAPLEPEAADALSVEAGDGSASQLASESASGPEIETDIETQGAPEPETNESISAAPDAPAVAPDDDTPLSESAAPAEDGADEAPAAHPASESSTRADAHEVASDPPQPEVTAIEPVTEPELEPEPATAPREEPMVAARITAESGDLADDFASDTRAELEEMSVEPRRAPGGGRSRDSKLPFALPFQFDWESSKTWGIVGAAAGVVVLLIAAIFLPWGGDQGDQVAPPPSLAQQPSTDEPATAPDANAPDASSPDASSPDADAAVTAAREPVQETAETATPDGASTPETSPSTAAAAEDADRVAEASDDRLGKPPLIQIPADLQDPKDLDSTSSKPLPESVPAAVAEAQTVDVDQPVEPPPATAETKPTTVALASQVAGEDPNSAKQAAAALATDTRTAQELKETLLSNQWHKGREPAEFFPSVTTRCRDMGDFAVCTTQYTRRKLTYVVQARLQDFGPDNQFTVLYRSRAYASGAKLSADPAVVQTAAWQRKASRTQCVLQGGRRIECGRSSLDQRVYALGPVPRPAGTQVAAATAPALEQPREAREAAATRPAPVEQTAALTPPAPVRQQLDFTPRQLKSALLRSSWGNRGNPAQLLPSLVNRCVDEGLYIGCMSSPQVQKTDKGSELNYRVLAKLTNFSRQGTFDIYYQAKVETSDKPLKMDLFTASNWSYESKHTRCRMLSKDEVECGADQNVRHYTR